MELLLFVYWAYTATWLLKFWHWKFIGLTDQISYWHWRPTHPRNNIPINKQNTHNPRKLIPTNLIDSTVFYARNPSVHFICANNFPEDILILIEIKEWIHYSYQICLRNKVTFPSAVRDIAERNYCIYLNFKEQKCICEKLCQWQWIDILSPWTVNDRL